MNQILPILVAVFGVLVLVLLVAWRRAVNRAAAPEVEDPGKAEMEARMAELVRAQDEMSGRVKAMTDVLGSKQSELLRGLSERLDGLGHRIGQSMTETTRNTHENLTRLNERLAVIDTAQKNITTLSTQVVELQKVLANKQTRGAFGQARMEAIVQDGLPASAYKFQATLRNGTRPDCLILFPNSGPSLVIDAKFPLEGWNAIRAATTPEATRTAELQFRRDTQKHIQDIADRYFIEGETQDTAFMFVPSESIFADIHERFEDIVQRAHRARVVIVSPSLLMLSVQVVLSLLRDVRVREQAHVIQQEVVKLLDDVIRLDDRVRKLQTHYNLVSKDFNDILISTGKITSQGERIRAVEFDEAAEKPRVKAAVAAAAATRNNGPQLPFNGLEEN